MKKMKIIIAVLMIATTFALTLAISSNAASPVVFGDANNDNKIDICDLVCAKKNNQNNQGNASVDYDFDNQISNSDISVVRKAILNGTIQELSCNACDLEDDFVGNPQQTD